ncbi:MAG TPA: branched-chain amino acid aminotransferase [Salinivirga sp.]|uniref:branched-chain amino acid aminotransferase n=1 Tax=Salinivirga sp. TaxID=1970192 RepID=UPI002B462801|nr:branched-chain amino acid aminotransferase [Salinivirga sp.]HKK58013.1 branched-chain amino acid aminotransferase [Salinivirga sp.]
MKNIDWSKLGFGYYKTDYNVRAYFKDGKWSDVEVSDKDTLEVNMAASGLHYGQQAFEGMKAFRGNDGQVRVFRWEENFKRLTNSSEGIMMAKVPEDLFKKMLFKVIELNKDYVPPRETEAALYIRPILFGSGAQVGVKPSNEYTFAIFVMPVGPYFKEGFKPVNVQIVRDADRAAPLGTGTLKVGGNYAASLKSGERAHDEGYAAALYLDAKEKKYVDECGPANFFGIKNNTYVTPKSSSILPSITNKSLIQLAEDMGLKAERRPIPVEELETFEECGACGTAAVISPIGKIVDRQSGKEYVYSKDGNVGPTSQKLYDELRAIQYGDKPDPHGWVTIV